MAKAPHVVVLGGGFAGINAVRELRKAPVTITLLDRENHHLFQPLLYQVASAVLNPADIAYPLRRIFRKQDNVTVLLGDAVRVHPEAGEVELDHGRLSYDYLVVATGAGHAYFGNPEWEHEAPGLKTVEDALEIRRRILLAYEGAEREKDPVKRREWLQFVVIGAGPTGVELAGALTEIARASASDYRRIDPDEVQVLLIDGEDRVLPGYEESLSLKAEEQLRDLGVQVRTGALVTELDADSVLLDSGERIACKTRIWAAGVQGSEIAQSLGASMDRAGRVEVAPDLSVPGQPEIFVAGDLAAVKNVPGVAPAAIQAGKHVAGAIRARLAGQDPAPFVYRDKGSMATIGRAAAVADFGFLKLSGILAWFAWLFVHILFLIGFRNRVWVLSGWAWSYLTWQRGARLITGRRRHRDLPTVSG
ncbi:MAG: NAD(P)/FAD-dependent oxidoreductase [Rhodothermales bacterium]|nr:NAD(P)/FAD-dependent oxidoreductase [Rhodothermales bacterium]MBO6781149.1 NAD(P)/FAD-dependent oxidoreductase [Rhodothermales bacterium]